MIEVFKTNVTDSLLAEKLRSLIARHFPGIRINFDLDDCDRVLRVQGNHFEPSKIARLLHEHSCNCEIME